MKNRHALSTYHSKSSTPSTVSCPHCGHSIGFFQTAARVRLFRRGRLRNSEQFQVALRAARGSLLWFVIVFTVAAMLFGAVQQNVWPMLCGLGLLALYGLTWYGLTWWGVARPKG